MASPTGVLYFKIITAMISWTNFGFFVPYWGSLFQNGMGERVVKIGNVFSSPTGVLYFKIDRARRSRNRAARVFVPYWGSLFQNDEVFELYAKELQFSSPAEVLYFKIYDRTILGICPGFFVPYWGSLFQNQ